MTLIYVKQSRISWVLNTTCTCCNRLRSTSRPRSAGGRTGKAQSRVIRSEQAARGAQGNRWNTGKCEHHSDASENPPLQRSDAGTTLAIFTDAVTCIAAKDYSLEQIRSWARPGERSAEDWHIAMSGRNSFVATIGEEVVGFSDVDEQGCIDMLFVSPGYQGLGVASAMLVEAEKQARKQRSKALSADVSITARSFFEKSGFTVEKRREPVRHGVKLVNHRMRKLLIPKPA